MALLNRRIFVQYDVPGPVLWHEPLVLRHVRDQEYVIATPDRDVYVEELGLGNADFRGVRAQGPDGGLPAGLRASQVYTLPVFSAAETAAINSEADQVLADEQAAAVLVAAAPAVAAGAGAAGAAVVAQPGPVIFDENTLYWVAAETLGAVKYGDAVAAVAAAASEGAKAVQRLAGGENLFVHCIRGRDRASFLRKPGGMDPRTLEVHLDGLGKPEISLKDLSTRCSEEKAQWSLNGPRTRKWCVNYLAVEGLGFEGHHERFCQLCKVDASSWGIQEHFQVSMMLKHAPQVDQLKGHNLLSVEMTFRRLQTIEFSYAEKAREAESRAVGGKLSLEEQQVLGGLTRLAATLMICRMSSEADLATGVGEARGENQRIPLHAFEDRFRDLLPLPLVEGEVKPSSSLSRGCQQRGLPDLYQHGFRWIFFLRTS